MVWYKDLYVGRLAQARRDQLIGAINRGEYPAGAYVIILPESESSQLEIIQARELRHEYIRTHCLMIVGLALGRTEAQSMVEALVKDVYRDRGDADIRAWLSVPHR